MIQKNSSSNSLKRVPNQKSEISLNEVLQIIWREKKIIIISTLITVTIALLNNIVSKPIYESSVVFKKESSIEKRTVDEFKEMFAMGTMDEVDTEIEILTTRPVLVKVVDELLLSVIIEKVDMKSGYSYNFDCNPQVYKYHTNQKKEFYKNLPKFLQVRIDDPEHECEYSIQVGDNYFLELYDELSEYVINSSTQRYFAEFDIPEMRVVIDWSNANIGDKIYFKVINRDKAIKNLRESITTERLGKTNLFKLTLKANSPEATQLIANTIAEKYRESRLDLRRQTIHNSFAFVDNQLDEISKKLKDAEMKLSNYKSEHQITIMDQSTRNVIESLSSLEAEKIKTDLELAENENKLKEMDQEMKEKGYFDQPYLIPSESRDARSPFSILLEQLSNAEIKRLELLQRRKENHPDVVTLDEQIAQIKSKLADYNQNTLTSYKIIINSLKKKRNDLTALIYKYSNKIEQLPLKETKLTELIREKSVYEKMFNLLLDKREELRIAEFSKLGDMVIVDSAQLPRKPIGPRSALNLGLGLLSGLFIGFVIILTQEFFNKKVSTIEEIEKIYTIPILTVVPKYSKEIKKRIIKSKNIEDSLVTLMSDKLLYTEPFRVLRTKLKNVDINGKNTLLFTSCESNTGKTTFVSNFAVSLARAGKKVLVIDCDLRKAKIAEYYKIPNKFPGVVEFLMKNVDEPEFYKPFKEDLYILPAGGFMEKSSELLGSERIKKLIDEYRPKYDYILIDTPPVTQIIDTIVLGEFVKNVILLIKPNHTYRGSIDLATEELQQAKMNILGFVFNACNKSHMSERYKYGYGYGYGDEYYTKK